MTLCSTSSWISISALNSLKLLGMQKLAQIRKVAKKNCRATGGMLKAAPMSVPSVDALRVSSQGNWLVFININVTVSFLLLLVLVFLLLLTDFAPVRTTVIVTVNCGIVSVSLTPRCLLELHHMGNLVCLSQVSASSQRNWLVFINNYYCYC